eukprot:TRINITY_DN4561_c0_g1_i1.p1 TRINITY_DN4561_c0_g1~~TRINITY_DN4561_c0_g1_i1.p1  ORF type:complete len:251 (-),score=29.22 TRINITY_DN4561_c0_g1_i1:51-803(-)
MKEKSCTRLKSLLFLTAFLAAVGLVTSEIPVWSKIVSPDGYEYDIEGLSFLGDQTTIGVSPIGETRYYFFALARALKIGCGYYGPCAQIGYAAVCQSWSPNNVWTQQCLAPWNPNDIQVIGIEKNGGVQVLFPRGDLDYQVQFLIKCKPSPDDKLTINVEDSEPNYLIIIETSAACAVKIPPSPLSVGSLTLICFGVAIMIYCFVGVFWNKFKRGKIGVEVIPNANFWLSLPSLVKDGVFFLTCRDKAEL